MKRPSNNHSFHLSNFLGVLKVAQQKRKVFCSYWPCPKLVILVAQALREEGYILGFSLTSEPDKTKRIKVFLKYYPSTFAPLITALQIYSSPSRQYNITYKKLVQRTRGKSALYFLSTSVGILTSEQCLSRVTGGNLLFKIW